MNIYHESTWVDPDGETEWLTISVIDMWHNTNAPCTYYKSGLRFCVFKCISTGNGGWKREIFTPNDETNQRIEAMGYTRLSGNTNLQGR